MNDGYKDFISPTKWKIYYSITYHIKDIYYLLSLRKPLEGL